VDLFIGFGPRLTVQPQLACGRATHAARLDKKQQACQRLAIAGGVEYISITACRSNIYKDVPQGIFSQIYGLFRSDDVIFTELE
jgi:hypothetical protein